MAKVNSSIFLVPEKELGGSASKKFRTRVEWTENAVHSVTSCQGLQFLLGYIPTPRFVSDRCIVHYRFRLGVESRVGSVCTRILDGIDGDGAEHGGVRNSVHASWL